MRFPPPHMHAKEIQREPWNITRKEVRSLFSLGGNTTFVTYLLYGTVSLSLITSLRYSNVHLSCHAVSPLFFLIFFFLFAIM